MIKAVLFDLDGTLVNTLCDLANSVNFVLKNCGFPERPQENFKQYVGNGISKMIERALPKEKSDFKTAEKLKAMFLEHYKEHCTDKSEVYEGIRKLLESLKNYGIKVCVVTNKAQKMCDEVLKKAFGDFEFDSVIGQREDIPMKPQPHMSYVAMNEIGVNPDECLFVGDSYTDMRTGASAGNIPVGVLWGYRDEKELLDSGAMFIVKKPNEILDIVKEINNT